MPITYLRNTITASADQLELTINDGGGSITVDAPIATPVNVQISDGTRTATVRDTGSNDSLNVAIVDASGNQITSFGGGGGGGTEYTVNAAAPTDPVGITTVMERDDQLSTLSEVEGDWTQPRATSKGALWVALADSSGDPITSFGGGTQYTEGDTDASIIGTAMLLEGAANTLVVAPGTTVDGLLVNLGTNNDVTVTGTVTANLAAGTNNIGDVDILSIPAPLNVVGTGTEAAALRVTIATDSTGVLSIDDNGGSITIDGTVTANAGTNLNTSALGLETTQASILTSVQLIDDSVQVLGTDTYTEAASKGLTIGAVRRDADTTLVNTTNEFGPLQMDANGRLKVEAFSGETLPVSLSSTTITSTVAVTQSGTWDEVGINDSGNSITVDAPLGTPVNVQIGNATLAVGVVDETGASAVDSLAIGGGTPHDSVDSGNPLKIGGKALDLGTTPTAVAANDRTNAAFLRNGIPFVLGGHPNTITKNTLVTAASGAQTDLSLVGAIAAGTAIVVTKISIMVANSTTVDVSARVGFGTANTPGINSAGIILYHPGIAAGSGVVEGTGTGIIGIGASDEELRITSGSPTTGSYSVIVTYFTVAIG